MVMPLAPDELVLETRRLILRPITLSDADLALAIYTDAEVVKYVGGLLAPDDALEYFHNNDTRRGAGGRLGTWSLTRKDSGTKIGSAVLLPMPVEKDDTDWSMLVDEAYPDAQIEVGYMLLQDAWGQGFATEACKRLVRFGFEMTSLPEIVATTDPENTASQNVLKKAGLPDEGMRLAYATQCSFFRLTREDYERNQTCPIT